jgi:hypothetical protein
MKSRHPTVVFTVNETVGISKSMKVKKLIQKLNRAEFKHNLVKAKELWFRLLKKSFKGKHTEAVK